MKADLKKAKESESFWERIIRDPFALFTFLLVIINFLLVASTVIQLIFLAGTTNAAKKSAEVAEKTLLATQRPWVAVRMDIGSGFKFNEQGTNITIRFIVKNVGNSPAIGTNVAAQIYLESPKRDMLAE
ncbi:MAG: hypothetical protein WBW55_14505 [Desulfobaccales bacterium]